ncbi:hypothetical protein ACRALDRAFT_1075869 [Sodiomyces alcalophilus JCM 7366]|uniref:uncharacterized protein n=1 Tax=Sodiomyces alcalophilus JCM 7366 TaxID=591952 RepID=UPI0039B61DF6
MTGMEAHAAADAPGAASKLPETKKGEENTSATEKGQKSFVSGTSLLAKLPFVRSDSATDARARQEKDGDGGQVRERDPPQPAPGPMATIFQQQQQQAKTRRRKGSLRKVALLGRGLQRREAKQLTIDTSYAATADSEAAKQHRQPQQQLPEAPAAIAQQQHRDEPNLPVSMSSQPHMDQFAGGSNFAGATVPSTFPPNGPGHVVESGFIPPNTYSSTTDEEDVLHLSGHGASAAHPDLSLSSGSDSYFGDRAATPPLRRRPMMRAKSPLSYSGLANTPIPPAEVEYDYSETEFWGWVVLIVTWIVFVVGMGSCLGIWSWAWDVGITPYAPPELEDDPTLPIVGYYPALIILTCIMAWVWVIIAWVGMKYFRHAKISGD